MYSVTYCAFMGIMFLQLFIRIRGYNQHIRFLRTARAGGFLSKVQFKFQSSNIGDVAQDAKDMLKKVQQKISIPIAEKNPGVVAGTNLRILEYPNPKLRQNNEEIVDFDDSLRNTVKEMFLLMYAADGIGLAAPQVGINKRLMIFNEKGSIEYRNHEYAIVNPRITSYSSLTNVEIEGCLSFPDIFGKVRRSISILVEYQTITGKPVSRRYEGELARIFQHEYDHLDKVLFIDHLNSEDNETNQRKIDKLVTDFKQEHDNWKEYVDIEPILDK